MPNLSKKIAAERENIEKALANLKSVSQKDGKSVAELAGMATFLHNMYNGIENILKQILKSNNIKISRFETWHKEVLDLSVANGIISESLSDQLYNYLSFRHFFIHAYGFMLKEDRLKELANNIPDVWSQFLLEIKDYLKKED